MYFLGLKKIIIFIKKFLNSVFQPKSLILFIFSGPALSLFGEGYVFAKQALWFLLAGQFFAALCGPGAIYLNMTGKQKKLNIILILGLVINVILNLALIPVYGIEGAAAATLISMIFWNSTIVMVIYRNDRIKIYIS